MGLHNLLTRGVRAALAEGDEDLVRYVVQGGHAEGTAEHLRQTLEAMPGLLVAIDAALRRSPAASQFGRTLFLVVTGYLLRDDDLIPVHEGQPLLGLLDDTYLLHRAAQELRDEIAMVDMRSVDGGASLLASVLPKDVVRQLDATIDRARLEAETLSGG